MSRALIFALGANAAGISFLSFVFETAGGKIQEKLDFGIHIHCLTCYQALKLYRRSLLHPIDVFIFIQVVIKFSYCMKTT